jgi:hypothetical protein
MPGERLKAVALFDRPSSAERTFRVPRAKKLNHGDTEAQRKKMLEYEMQVACLFFSFLISQCLRASVVQESEKSIFRRSIAG